MLSLSNLKTYFRSELLDLPCFAFPGFVLMSLECGYKNIRIYEVHKMLSMGIASQQLICEPEVKRTIQQEEPHINSCMIDAGRCVE